MKTNHAILLFGIIIVLLTGCAGMKVVNPNEQNQNSGTMAVDASGGKLKLVSTVTCKLESMGKRHSAIGKTEEDARKEVVAKCRDNTLISNCEPSKVTCEKN